MIEIYEFEKLKIEDLYEILRLRSEVFVVEQKCVYQDLDGLDQKAHHLIYRDGEIKAYLRIIKSSNEDKVIKIGRVLVVGSYRGKNIATKIVRFAVEFILENYKGYEIHLSAQVYAKSLYEKIGFVQCAEMFLEDGIAHINMEYK